MTQMSFTEEDVEAFIERFCQQKPDPNAVPSPRPSTRALVVRVYPDIVKHMAAGHEVPALVEHFRNLGVHVTESTLRNYIGYARRQSSGNASPQRARARKAEESRQARAVGKEALRPSVVVALRPKSGPFKAQ